MTAYKCAVQIQKRNLGITFPSANQEAGEGEVQFGEIRQKFQQANLRTECMLKKVPLIFCTHS